VKRLGVVGTMVWDRILARDGRAAPVEEWGGIAYALEAASAAAPPDWSIAPIIKVGRDMGPQAWAFFGQVPGLASEAGLRLVEEPNNRVELRYQDGARRCERLSGGVPAWEWPELAPLLDDLDALYINFISGFEMGLDTARQVRIGFKGPIYADLHSLFLGVGRGGLRTPQPLEHWTEWLRSFDIVQVNEDELALLAGAWGDPWRFAAQVVGVELRLLLVTLGVRGAAYVASPLWTPDPRSWHAGRDRGAPLGGTGPARSERVALAPGEPASDGDPTGCGDVWGATCFLGLLAGRQLEPAMAAANHAAASNVRHRGATGLHLHLKGRIHT
jgi:pfkB family carbohydrate kinase